MLRRNHTKLVCMSILCLGYILTSCSSTGYAVARHNGKYYWFPEKCKQYQYSYLSPDILYCTHKGIKTGQYLTPASSDAVAAYQQREAEAWAGLNKSLENMNQNLQQQNQQNRPKITNCMNLGYGQVSCTTY